MTLELPSDPNTSRGPLAGYRVVDLTRVLLGPFAAQMLGDMGAEVIKVEDPEGDISRKIGHIRNPGMSAIYLNCNRNKKSVCLDLKTADGKQAMDKLLASADLFIHALRPQAARKLGLGYEDVQKLNPNIVYIGAYGYSEQGPSGHKTAFDDMIQGASGGAAIQGWMDDTPSYVSFVQADKTTGMMAANAALAGLLHRERTGEGQFIEVPMFETMTMFNMVEHLDGATFAEQDGPFCYSRLMTRNRRPFKSKDGWVGLLPYSDKNWKAVFEAAGHPELMEDERFNTFEIRQGNIDRTYEKLAELALLLTTDEWLTAMDAASVPCTRINTPADLLADPHLNDVGFWQQYDHPKEGRLRTMAFPVNFSRSPAEIRRHAPDQGEQTREVLQGLGYTDEQITEMLRAGAAIEPS